MNAWMYFLIGAAAVVALSAWVDAFTDVSWRDEPWSALRVGGGLAITLTAVGTVGLFAGVRTVEPPEVQGIAVLVDGVTGRPERGSDVGMFAALHVEVSECDERVDARLTLAPTAEFWIDNRELLEKQATIRFGIPGGGVSDIRAFEGDERSLPLPSAQGIDAQPTELDDVVVDVEDDLTTATVVVQNWSRTLHPVTIHFTANWATERSTLGGCYLELPALTGFPTVLTAARVLGEAVPLDQEPPEPRSFFVVASPELGLHAFYNPFREITRGVTTVALRGHTIDEGLSAPGPTGSLYGSPAWQCRSDIVDDVGFLDAATEPAAPASEYVLGEADDASGSFSAEGIGRALSQSSCGTFAVLDDPGSGTRRDAVLIFAGAMFSLGIELVLTGLRRRKDS